MLPKELQDAKICICAEMKKLQQNYYLKELLIAIE